MTNFEYNLSKYALATFPSLFIGKAGVYMWTNNINGKRYVGSSNNISRRISEYLNVNRLNAELARGESLIYKAMLKYGYECFSFTILELVDLDNDMSSEEKSDVLELSEQKYLDMLIPEYNLLKTAGSNQGFKMSEEARAKINAAKKGKTSHRKGKTMTDETRELMRLNSAKSKVVYMYSSDHKLVETFDSITSCAIKTGISRFAVSRSLDTMKLIGGYYFTSKL